MPDSPDLEARVTALETEVRQLADRVRHSEQDAAAARVLAGGADRDVAEIRTEIREFRDQNNRVLNAMREDMVAMREDMGTTRQDIAAMGEDLSDLRQKMSAGFIEMRGKLDATAAGLQQVTGMLTTLIDQQGTRPNDK
jgi:chromosome segregation ATPase